MFDLDRALAEWRRQMLARDVATADALEELESHLREEVRRQAHVGLSEEQAFKRAIERIGSASVLKEEFEKISETKAAREHRLMLQISSGLGALYLLIGVTPILFKVGGFADLSFSQKIAALGAVAAAALFLFGVRYFGRVLPSITRQILRMTICVFAIIPVLVWLFVFYHLVMTRYELMPGQLGVAVLWALVPMAALCGFIGGLEDAARRRLEHV